MTPRPPMKCVEERQNSRLFGRLSMSVRIVEPVVVYPETLSNQAFISVNSPPQSTYGSIPNMNERSQAVTIVRKPDCIVVAGAFLTNIKGNIPVRKVTRKLISRGVNAGSKPFAIDMPMDMSINKALISSALPMFVDMAFMLIRFRNVF